MPLQTISIVAIIISVVAIALSLWSLRSGKKFKFFSEIFDAGHRPDNLEDVLISLIETIKKLNADQIDLKKFSEQQAAILQTAFRYTSVVRFNSTGTDGGNLSFTVALLDSNQDGFLITSLHGREHNRIYCKAVAAGQGKQPLNEEEQQAVIEALTSSQKLS